MALFEIAVVSGNRIADYDQVLGHWLEMQISQARGEASNASPALLRTDNARALCKGTDVHNGFHWVETPGGGHCPLRLLGLAFPRMVRSR